MFTGFERGTFEFFMALSFNNNREFFHSNHDWYEKSVRTPLRELCQDLAPALLAIDPELEVRPQKVISHINRDLRYSRDKSPYRDYMWLGFHKQGVDKRDCFHFYFDISAYAVHSGAGMYGDDRAWMEALRGAIRNDTDGVRDIIEDEALDRFELGGSAYKRIDVPQGLGDKLNKWYVRRAIYLEKTYSVGDALSQELVRDIADDYRRLKRVYDFMFSIRPDRGMDEAEDTYDRMAAGSFYQVGKAFEW